MLTVFLHTDRHRGPVSTRLCMTKYTATSSTLLAQTPPPLNDAAFPLSLYHHLSHLQLLWLPSRQHTIQTGRLTHETGPNDAIVVWAPGKFFYVRFLCLLLQLTYVFVLIGFHCVIPTQ
jgi:hypothetical protein